jgi:hypothetical protein
MTFEMKTELRKSRSIGDCREEEGLRLEFFLVNFFTIIVCSIPDFQWLPLMH